MTLAQIFAIAFGAAMGAIDHRIARECGLPEREVTRLRLRIGLRKTAAGAAA